MITLATGIEEALAAPGEWRAGGTDLEDRRRLGISAGPLVDISRISGLDAIEWRADGGASVGALTRISALASDEAISRHYPGLAQAAGDLATPQIRAIATVGGCLLQRTQCLYFRQPAFQCFKKGGSYCPARAGHHRNGVCFDLGPCVYPHPSTLGMALLAYEAEIRAVDGGRSTDDNRTSSISALYGDGSNPMRDHLLGEREILTQVVLPPPLPGEKSAYFRAISRATAEWPLVESLVRLQLDEAGMIRLARVAVGGVANIPLRLHRVEEALVGRPATEDVLEQAAAFAGNDANPLPQTGYKVHLMVGTVLETLERALRVGY